MDDTIVSEVTAAAKPAAKAAAAIDAGKVTKPFNTPNRRFKEGTDVARADLAGTPLDFDRMVDKGFIKAA